MQFLCPEFAVLRLSFDTYSRMRNSVNLTSEKDNEIQESEITSADESHVEIENHSFKCRSFYENEQETLSPQDTTLFRISFREHEEESRESRGTF